MQNAEGQLERLGYIEVPYELDEASRAEFALCSKEVIALAVEDQAIANMLTFDALAEVPGHVRQASYGVSGPVNSADDKLTLHIGYQSQARADQYLAERNQPVEMRRLWKLAPDVFAATEASAKLICEAIGEPELFDLMYDEDPMERNVLLRTALYIGARSKQVGHEAFSGHLDLGIMSLHLFETHGGWFSAAPVPADLVIDKDTPERSWLFGLIRDQLRAVRFNHSQSAAAFLGASYKQVTKRADPLVACYHAGPRPHPDDEQVSVYAQALPEEDRLVQVNFLSPSLKVLRDPSFVTPSVAACRPEWT